MINNQQNESDYIIEEKTGKIVNIEESNEKQKQQKQELLGLKRFACQAIITLGIAGSIASTVGAVKLYELHNDAKLVYEEELLNSFELLGYDEDRMFNLLISIGKTEEEAQKEINKLKEQLTYKKNISESLVNTNDNTQQNITVGKER